MTDTGYSKETGLPMDESYLECGLPPYLEESIQKMEEAWAKLDSGEEYLHWDCDFCELQSNINVAEVSGQISTEQSWYLREKYLGLRKEDNA